MSALGGKADLNVIWHHAGLNRVAPDKPSRDLGPPAKWSTAAVGRSRMTDSVSTIEHQLIELKGANDLLFELREEFAQWVEEAQDASKREALENVLGHIEALESEYRNRQDELQKKAKSA